MKDAHKSNTTARGCPRLDSDWKESALERGETDWPELPITEEEPYSDTTHYRVLKGRYFDPDDEFGQRAFDWPPLDRADDRYPLDWFHYTDLDENGKLVHEETNSLYSPFNGNRSETSGRCNAVLDACDRRFPEPRYCGSVPTKDSEYCKSHRGREQHILDHVDAGELTDTGLFAKTVDHTYEGLPADMQVLAWGLFASLLGESTYEFDPIGETRSIDFTDIDAERTPAEADEDSVVEVTVTYPTTHLGPALCLFSAAVDAVKMLQIQPRLLDGDDGGVMATTKTAHAQLTAPPSEHDSSPQEWKEIRELREHPLNLSYSRLVRNRAELLRRGGIAVDPEDDAADVDDIGVDLDATAFESVPDKDDRYGDNEDGVTKDIADAVEQRDERDTTEDDDSTDDDRH